MKYLMLATMTGVLAFSSLGFAQNETPKIGDLKLVRETAAAPAATPEPGAIFRYPWRFYGRPWRFYGRPWRFYGNPYGGYYGYYGNPNSDSHAPRALPSPQAD